MQHLNCVPRDKHDLEALRRAASVGFPGLNAVLPELLVWLQDGNWPVAPKTAWVLSNAGCKIVPHLRTILESEDAEWAFWVIELLLTRLDLSLVKALRPQLDRLAHNPTPDERNSETDMAARRLLETRLI